MSGSVQACPGDQSGYGPRPVSIAMPTTVSGTSAVADFELDRVADRDIEVVGVAAFQHDLAARSGLQPATAVDQRSSDARRIGIDAEDVGVELLAVADERRMCQTIGYGPSDSTTSL